MHIIDNSNSWLTIFHQNETGLSDKNCELMCSLISSMFTPHFLCLSEHFVTLQNLSTISLDNYYLPVFHVLIILDVEYVYSLGQICNRAHVMSLNFVLKKCFVLVNWTW